MQHFARLLILFTLAFSTSLQAASSSFMRFDNGKVLVKKGSPVTLLTQYLGSPLHSSRDVVCMDKRRSEYCKKWGTVETWLYRYDERNWEIKVYGGRILHIKWTRN